MRPAARDRELGVLEDWILGESVSFRKLDDHRCRLGLEDAEFARLLGVATRTYKRWKTNGEVPLNGRDEMHGEVQRYRAMTAGAQNARFKAVLGGFTGAVDGVLSAKPFWRIVAPSRTTREPTREASPHLFIPLDERSAAREVRLAAERRRDAGR